MLVELTVQVLTLPEHDRAAQSALLDRRAVRQAQVIGAIEVGAGIARPSVLIDRVVTLALASDSSDAAMGQRAYAGVTGANHAIVQGREASRVPEPPELGRT